jgi:hypothetical protein
MRDVWPYGFWLVDSSVCYYSGRVSDSYCDMARLSCDGRIGTNIRRTTESVAAKSALAHAETRHCYRP